MSKNNQKKNDALYFLPEEKYFSYLLSIEEDRIAIKNLLESHFNKSSTLSEEIFSVLCECYGALFHLEATLFAEEAIVSYDKENKGYLLDSGCAARAVIFLEVVNLSKKDLHQYNISILRH
jgi:hypothetical protein